VVWLFCTVYFFTAQCYADRGYEIVCRLSVCLSVRPWRWGRLYRFSHRLEYFENNITAKQLKTHALGDPNMGDPVQRKHPQIKDGIGVGSLAHKTCRSPETVQDRTKVTRWTHRKSHTRFRLAPNQWSCRWKNYDKTFSYRRETARQLPTWRGTRPSRPPPSAPLATSMHMVESEKRNRRTSSVPSTKRTLTLNRAFKVIQGHPNWCRQESRTVGCHNVSLIPTLFLKFTNIWQQENGKIVDFNDPTQVWRRPSKKRIRLSTNDLYCQILELLTYISAADSMGLHSLVFT